MYYALTQKGVDIVSDPARKFSPGPENVNSSIVSFLYYEGDLEPGELYSRLTNIGVSSRRLIARQLRYLVRIGLVEEVSEFGDPEYTVKLPGNNTPVTREDLRDTEDYFPDVWFRVRNRN